MNATTATTDKPAIASKINLVSIATFIISILATFGLDLDAEKQATILGLVATIQPVLIFVLRTWFTKTGISGLFS